MSRMTAPATFGTVLREAREQARMPADKLARVAGVSLNTVKYLESDLHSPKLSVVFKLAAALGIPAGRLVGRMAVPVGGK